MNLFSLCNVLSSLYNWDKKQTVFYMSKGNPNPFITPEFEQSRFKRADGGTEPLAEKLLCVRLTQSVDARVRSLPNMSSWVRRVITEAAQRELMKDDVLSLSKDGEV
jgi:hypothetical protein